MNTKKSISQKDYELAIELLKGDKLSDVLEILDELGFDVILQKGLYARDKEEYRANRLSPSDYSVSRSRAGQAILEFIKTLIIVEKSVQSEIENQASQNPSSSKKNILEKNTISSENLNIHAGDVHNVHIHYYGNDQRIEQKKGSDKIPAEVNPDKYINKISDSFINKLEKYLMMSSEYQYSFSSPEYRILSFHFLSDIIIELEESSTQIDELDDELFIYAKEVTHWLKKESKIISSLKSVLIKSKLKNSPLFSMVHLVLSKFIFTINQIERQKLDAIEGVDILDREKTELIEELKRIRKSASNYSLN